MVDTLYQCRCVALLLQIIRNGDLLDVLYVPIILMFEVNNCQPFSFGG